MNSLEKKLKCKAVNFNEMIKSYTRSWQQVKAVKENKKWVQLEDVLKELGVVAQKIREKIQYWEKESKQTGRFLIAQELQEVFGLLVEKEEKP